MRCLLLLVVLSSPAVAAEFRDCAECPLMVQIPAGSFLMGTAVEDRLIDPRTGKPATNDSPQHEVALADPFALGKYEVTVAEFAAFASATGYETTERCMEFSKESSFAFADDVDWRQTGFVQADNQPVVCVSYFDALAYTGWLSERTGKSYRLPSEAEWEYAARAGSRSAYHWGVNPAQACDYANVRSEGAYTISKRQAEADKAGFPCDDSFVHSSPVGSLLANGFGLYDVQGNAWEWVADCNHKDYAGAPVDGSAWIDAAECGFAVIRGGSYLNLVERSSTTVRAGRPKTGGATNMGFRVARGSAGSPSGTTLQEGAVAEPGVVYPEAVTAGGRLFEKNCAACHVDRTAFEGIYGKDQGAVEAAIRDGGNNVMSMPAFADRMTDEEISAVATYVREVNGWR